MMMYKFKKTMEREGIYERLREEHETWKDFFFYGLYGLIEKEAIFSKLPRMLINRELQNEVSCCIYDCGYKNRKF